MESIASYSPSVPSREGIVRQSPSSAVAAGLAQLARCGTVAAGPSYRDQPPQSERMVKNLGDDDRDDAIIASRRDERMEWKYHQRAGRSSSSMSTPSPVSRHPVVRRQHVEQRSHGNLRWQQSSEWHASKRPNTSGAFHTVGRSLSHAHAGGMVPISHEASLPSPSSQVAPSYPPVASMINHAYSSSPHWSQGYQNHHVPPHRPLTSSNRGGHSSSTPPVPRSRVIIPEDIIIPKEIVSPSSDVESPAGTTEGESIGKRSSDSWHSSPSTESTKRVKKAEPLEGGFDKLDLLCSATLGLGRMMENPTGCSCPKSKCVALYCDCFKAGRRCDPNTCTCLNCKNTVGESGFNGARSKAIQAILARNPRAFTTAGNSNAANKVPPGEACNCIRSQCLKLYCTCFQGGKVCNPEICTCVGCLNTKDDVGGKRQLAIQATLEKRPDAFQQKKKIKDIGAGCACKNNRCIRKYCECFRTNLACTSKCSCRDCENPEKV